jgi:GH43 family beta-xylosidase
MAANKQLTKLAVALLAIFSSGRLPAATVGTFMNPVIADGADPWVIFADTNYFYTQTTGGQVTIRKSPTLTGLGFASPVTVFTPSAPNNKDVWAPELHFLRGKWYIYFAADNGNNANHRLYVAEANTSDPQGAYTSKGKIYDPANDRWAIDGTVLEKDDGSLYLIWSGWPGTSNTRQNIYIAPMSDPWTISGPRVLLSTPALDWEVYPDSSLPLINEGPEVLKRNGKIFIVYSANKAWEDAYCLGLLVNTNGDVLNTNAWTKHPTPVFTGFVDETGAVYGPGHCSFARTLLQTEDWIIYHAAKFSGAGFNRSIRLQPFSWNGDDTPFFGSPIGTNLPVIFPAGEGPSTPVSVNPNVTNGMLQLEVFTDIPGATLDALTNHSKFPDHPDIVRYVAQFEMPPNVGDNYGARLSGFLVPPLTGNYVFYMASDDQGTLFLSTNSQPAGKRLIASEPQWNVARDWTGTDRRPAHENVSAPVFLQAGQSYYIEALVKEAEGSDNLAVAWQKPGDSPPVNGSAPIPGAYLAIPFDSTITVAPVVLKQPTNRTVYATGSASFQLNALSFAPVRYQWQHELSSNNWQNLVGGYGSLLSLSQVAAADAGNYRSILRNAAGFVGSDSASLRVLDLPRLIASRPAPGAGFTFSFAAETGFTYQVQATTNFMNWQTIASLTSTQGPATFTDAGSTNRAQRAYRLGIQ